MKMATALAVPVNSSLSSGLEMPYDYNKTNLGYDFPFSDFKNISVARDFIENNNYSLCRNEKYQDLAICHKFNQSMNSQEDPQDSLSKYIVIVKWVVPIIFGIVVLVGVFGNSLVVIVIIVNKQMRSTTNYLIFSLAIADLLFTVFCVPFTASDYIFVRWPFGVVWCKMVQYLTYFTAYASVYTLLLLSFDRYLAVVHPIYAITIRTEKNAILAIVCTWSLLIVSNIPLFIVHGLNEDGSCTFLEQYHYAAFHIGFITTMYFIPLAVIVILYLQILQRLWSQKVPGGKRNSESKKRVTRMVVVVVVTFIICWLPIQIVLVLKSLGKYEMTTFFPLVVQIFAHVLAYMNSCINPILYAFLSDPFRKAFHKVISCGPNRKTLNGRLPYDDPHTSRPMNAPRQSVVMATLAETTPSPPQRSRCIPSPNEAGLASGVDDERKCMLPLVENAITTTSFICHSKAETGEHQNNLNGLL